MNESLRAGAVVYAKDVARVGAFYAQVAGFDIVYAGHDYVVLEAAGCQLVVVAIPARLAAAIRIAEPPRVREDCALKLVLTVASIAGARMAARSAGGGLKPPECEWEFRGCRVCDGHDPEGNVVQFREASLALVATPNLSLDV